MKTAVILFNLGGPDGPEAVYPFLYNLFSDRAILRMPGIFRKPLAWFIARARAHTAAEIYAQMGGASPILPQTQAQATALEEALGAYGEYKTFVCMRYWNPRSAEVAEQVKAFAPDRIILLPLYPQFSTTTTYSSLLDWHKAAAQAGLQIPTYTVMKYPTAEGFVQAHVQLIRSALEEAMKKGPPRVLFSAHGLPESIVYGGDPYPDQVEDTVAAIVRELGEQDLDYVVCFQSRVGPLAWIGPGTDAEIIRAGRDKRAVVIVPVAFVSEHSETLVELDIEYAALAKEYGVAAYIRTPTPGTHPAFIQALAELCVRNPDPTLLRMREMAATGEV